MTTEERAEVLISKWIQWIQLWAEDDLRERDLPPTGGAYVPPPITRDYIVEYWANGMAIDNRENNDPQARNILSLYLALDDELNNATLIGIWEGNTLLYAVMETDTDWQEFYRASYPLGFINASNPFVRADQWLHAPDWANPKEENPQHQENT